MRRKIGIVLIAALVILAGCSGLFVGDRGDSERSTSTVTPMAVPTDEPTPTPTPQLAPGLTQQGIVDRSALLSAHDSYLQNRSFTLHTNQAALASNGTLYSGFQSTLQVGPPETGVYYTGNATYPLNKTDTGYNFSGNRSPILHRESWSTGDHYFQKQTFTNETTIYAQQRGEGQLRGGYYLNHTIESFGANNTSVQRQQRNGSTYYLVQGDIQRGASYTYENRSLRLLIDERGLIHKSHLEYKLSEGGQTLVFNYELSDVGDTEPPDRPSWIGMLR